MLITAEEELVHRWQNLVRESFLNHSISIFDTSIYLSITAIDVVLPVVYSTFCKYYRPQKPVHKNYMVYSQIYKFVLNSKIFSLMCIMDY